MSSNAFAPSRRYVLRLAASGLSAASIAALTGCGSDSATSSSSGNGPAKITVVVAPVQFEPFYYAQENGLFTKHNLEVTAKTGGAADTAIAQLVSGEVQFAQSSAVAAISAAAKKIPVKIVLGNTVSAPTNASGLLVAEKSPITKVADLAGKKVGINGLRNTTQLIISTGIDSTGGDSSSTQYVELPYPAMADALKRGTVDAVYAVNPYYNAEPGSGFRALDNPAVANGGSLFGMSSVAWVASNAYIASNKDVIERFQQAMTESMTYLNAHIEDSRKVTAAHSKQTMEVLEKLDFTPFEPTMNLAANKTTVASMKKYGFIDSEPAVADFIASIAPQK